MTVDKTGADVTITDENRKYTISVEGQVVGLADYADRGQQRVFHHTEIDPEFGGRGLATLLLEQALQDTQAAGKRIVPVCSMVVTVLKKHPEYNDITDPVTAEVVGWVNTQPK
ncbi:GNAT family N-acetyltransferase [Mycobacterium asiaticum]|uniref:Acetyltransferase n=1 Tax=Mycobacterium asiaticum TaxID=1790 RepID=A0A1A3MRE6_MYCAS|nr:GNAT family N-acetyltransferase [Mycobacterium asiaticum]OBK10757.1 acetyltransferase [Mycobacterium asiaticum]